MKSAQLLERLDELEACLKQDPEHFVPENLDAWHKEFLAESQEARKDADWPQVVERAHQLSQTIQALLPALIAKRDELKQELAQQNQGMRALNAYQVAYQPNRGIPTEGQSS